MAKIIVLVGYARSGVTVLNRCLSSNERLICLSEINSRFVCPTSPNTINEQMYRWYNIGINQDSIINELKTVSNLANKSGKILLVRDWSFASFVPLEYNNFNPPKSLNTIDDISLLLHETVSFFALVRNPVDVWLSMKNSVKSFHDPKLTFLRDFILEVLNRKIPIFKYEDFCKDTSKVLNGIYDIIGVRVPNNISLSSNVIGDVNYPESSRGADVNRIYTLPRRKFSMEDKEFLKNKTYAKEILELLSYSDDLLL